MMSNIKKVTRSNNPVIVGAIFPKIITIII